MGNSYREDVLVLRGPAGPDDIRGINDFLAEMGRGRPLAIPDRVLAEGDALPVSGVDAKSINDLLWDHRDGLARLPRLGLQFEYVAGTHPIIAEGPPPADRRFGEFDGSGVKAGHSALTWVEELSKDLPDPPAWRRMPHGERRPVVALLDTHVVNHEWLPQPGPDDDAFLLTPEVPWETDGPWWRDIKVHGHRGHATFIAGLIRLRAPDAQILSLPVMREDGKVDEDTAIGALGWLGEYLDAGNPVDVLCLAFGRQPDTAHGDDGRRIGEPLRRLAAAGVRIVASAGNDGTNVPAVPAAIAPELHGYSVGAGRSETVHAGFSNHGAWVNAWEDGENVLSIEPLRLELTGDDPFQLISSGWARWSGTSFSAGRRAGDAAARVVQRG